DDGGREHGRSLVRVRHLEGARQPAPGDEVEGVDELTIVLGGDDPQGAVVHGGKAHLAGGTRGLRRPEAGQRARVVDDRVAPGSASGELTELLHRVEDL